MKHPLFKGIRLKEEEQVPYKVIVDIDQNELAETYDDTEKTNEEKDEMISYIKMAVVKEYLKFNEFSNKVNIKFISSN